LFSFIGLSLSVILFYVKCEVRVDGLFCFIINTLLFAWVSVALSNLEMVFQSLELSGYVIALKITKEIKKGLIQ